jgi:hypothetical protein
MKKNKIRISIKRVLLLSMMIIIMVSGHALASRYALAI